MLLGLTGGYCAGKNTAAAILEERGWTCIDVDSLGHEAIQRAAGAIVERFGPSVRGPDGRVDRKALAAIVFSDKKALADQEAIVHPIAIRMMDELIESIETRCKSAEEKPLICLNAALLYVAPQASRCDAIVEIRAPLPIRLRRARARDGAGILAALKRIRRQRGLWRRRSSIRRPIVFLRNGGSRLDLEARLDRGLEQARDLASRFPIGGPGSIEGSGFSKP
ncbi:MAG: dephospho-CoA kinase [Rectinemataceae bacterium]